jgi:hypothetical protein
MWQEIMALAIVAAAAGYVAFRAWRRLRGRAKNGCSACKGCNCQTLHKLK